PILQPHRLGRYVGLSAKPDGPGRVTQRSIRSTEERFVLQFKSDQKCRVRQIFTYRDGGGVNLRSIGGRNFLGGLIVSLGNSWPVVTHSHCGMGQRLETLPILTINAEGRCDQTQHARLAGLLPRIAMIESTRCAPGLHGADEAKQQCRHQAQSFKLDRPTSRSSCSEPTFVPKPSRLARVRLST